MAFDLLSALGGIGTEQEYQAQNPFFTAGQNIINTRLPTAETNAQAIFGPVLQGFLGGALGGYGQNQARQSMFSDYMASPLRETNIGPIASGRDYASLLSTVGNPTAPTADWNPESSRAQLLMGALAKQSQIEAQQKADAIKAELAAKTSPEALMGIMETAQAESLGKRLGEGTKPAKFEIGAELQGKLAGSKALINELESTATLLDKGGESWADLRLAKAFGVTDQSGVISKIANLKDMMARARSGASLNATEEKNFDKILTGDFTVPPKQVASLMRKLAKSEAESALAKIDTISAISQGPDAARAIFQPQAPKIVTTSKPISQMSLEELQALRAGG